MNPKHIRAFYIGHQRFHVTDRGDGTLQVSPSSLSWTATATSLRSDTSSTTTACSSATTATRPAGGTEPPAFKSRIAACGRFFLLRRIRPTLARVGLSNQGRERIRPWRCGPHVGPTSARRGQRKSAGQIARRFQILLCYLSTTHSAICILPSVPVLNMMIAAPSAARYLT